MRTPTGRFTPHKTYKSVYSEQFKMNLPHLVAITSNIGIHGTHAVGKLGRPASAPPASSPEYNPSLASAPRCAL